MISSASSTVLDLPPSCIEFSIANPEFFVVGTYHLDAQGDDSSQQTRKGSLILFRLRNDEA